MPLNLTGKRCPAAVKPCNHAVFSARLRAVQAAGGGMSLAMVAMVLASLGALNATGAAVAQEFIDIAAILWALVPTRKRV
jgi:hypothetical protein